MADLIKKIKIKKQDGTFTDYIPIGAEAKNISTNDGESVELKLNKKPYYYDTVADMKADTKLKAGDMAITLGYYSVNDGGGAKYKIVNDSTLIDDGGSIHELENGLRAELIVENSIFPEMFGAKGDEISDDTEAINKAIQSLTRGGIIYFKPKTYLIKGTININKRGITLMGVQTTHHNIGTILKATNDTTDPLIKVNASFRIIGGGLKNITLFGSNARYEQSNTVNRIGLLIQNTAEFMIDNVNINGFYNEGLYANQWWDSTVYNLQISACGNLMNNKYAIYLTSTNDSTNSIKFTGCHFEFNNLFLKLDHLASNIHLEECKFEKGGYAGNPEQLILIDEGVYNVIFTNCFFAQNSENYPVFNIKNNYTSIIGCSFSSGTSNAGYWIDHNGNGNNTGNGLIINGNYFNANTNKNNAIKLQNNAIFSNNIMELPNDSDNNFVIRENAIISNNIFKINGNTNTIFNFISPTNKKSFFINNDCSGFTNKFITGPGGLRNVNLDTKMNTIQVLSQSTINADLPYSDYFVLDANLTISEIKGGKLGQKFKVFCNTPTIFTCANNTSSITINAGGSIEFEYIDNNLKWWVSHTYKSA